MSQLQAKLPTDTWVNATWAGNGKGDASENEESDRVGSFQSYICTGAIALSMKEFRISRQTLSG